MTRPRSGGLRLDSQGGSAQRRRVRTRHRRRRSGQEPADRGRAPHRRAQDADGRRSPQRREDRRPRGLGQGRRRLARRGSGRREAGVGPQRVTSRRNIRPVLAQQCFACHTNTKSGGLRLDSMKDMLTGGKSGPAVVPGDPDKSLLIAAIRHSGTLRMPKGGTRLTDTQIAELHDVGEGRSVLAGRQDGRESSTPTRRKRSGRFSRCRTIRCRPSRTPPGRSTTSIGLCWRGWRRKV